MGENTGNQESHEIILEGPRGPKNIYQEGSPKEEMGIEISCIFSTGIEKYHPQSYGDLKT